MGEEAENVEGEEADVLPPGSTTIETVLQVCEQLLLLVSVSIRVSICSGTTLLVSYRLLPFL